MGENLIEDRVAGFRAEYKKKLNKISKKRFNKKFDYLAKSQQKTIKKVYKKVHPDYIVQPENVDDDHKLQELAKKIPEGRKSKPSKQIPSQKTKEEKIYVLSDESKPRITKHISFETENDIEDLLEKNIEILEKNALIIGRQVRTGDGKYIDLLALDKNANTIIIELKKGETPHFTSSQIFDYFSWIKRQKKQQQINEIAEKNHLGKFHTIEQKFNDRFGNIPNDWNLNQRLIIVGEQIDNKTKQVASDLLEHDFNITCVELNAFDLGQEKIVSIRTIPLEV